MCAQPFLVLGAAISKESLGGAGAWGLILSALGVGSLVGGLVALRIRPRRPFVTAFALYLPFALPSLLLAAGAGAGGVAAAALVSGAGLIIGNSVWETTLQQHVPDAVLSRVTAYDWFGSVVATPIGNALIGPLVVLLGTSGTLFAAGITILVSGAIVLSLPSIRAVRRVG